MGKTKTTEKKCKKRSGLFSVLLLLVFLISLGACVYLLYGEISKEISIKDMEEDIHTFVKPTGQPAGENTEDKAEKPETPDDGDDYIFDWDGMKAKSKWIIGWIQVPGIDRIDYPIVQNPDDNQFFLKRDWTGKYQSAGSIFMNRYNKNDFSDMNTILYGHRMRAGSMFGSLKYYRSQEFMDKHPYFHIYTPDGRKLVYEIVCYSSVKDGSDAYLMHFDSPDERMAYYKMMIHNSITKRDVELNQFDTTVMLSTCNTTGYYDRIVVLGKLASIDLYGQFESRNP